MSSKAANKTGRFINADAPEYTDTYSGSPLSTNMFAYCENNTVNYFDLNGKDAVLLFQKDGAWIFGHTAILVRYKNNWYYCSVASKRKEDGNKMEIDIANLGKKLNAKSKDEINKAIEKAKNITHAKYTSKYYIKGNFNKSYSFFKNLKKKPEVYHLLTNNCLHVASRALYKGKCTGKNAEY